MKKVISILLFILVSSTVGAQLRLPAIFGDHMVIQKNATVPIWGWAGPHTASHNQCKLGYNNDKDDGRQHNVLEDDVKKSVRARSSHDNN